jgi:hypothetical protein
MKKIIMLLLVVFLLNGCTQEQKEKAVSYIESTGVPTRQAERIVEDYSVNYTYRPIVIKHTSTPLPTWTPKPTITPLPTITPESRVIIDIGETEGYRGPHGYQMLPIKDIKSPLTMTYTDITDSVKMAKRWTQFDVVNGVFYTQALEENEWGDDLGYFYKGTKKLFPVDDWSGRGITHIGNRIFYAFMSSIYELVDDKPVKFMDWDMGYIQQLFTNGKELFVACHGQPEPSINYGVVETRFWEITLDKKVTHRSDALIDKKTMAFCTSGMAAGDQKIAFSGLGNNKNGVCVDDWKNKRSYLYFQVTYTSMWSSQKFHNIFFWKDYMLVQTENDMVGYKFNEKFIVKKDTRDMHELAEIHIDNDGTIYAVDFNTHDIANDGRIFKIKLSE